MKASAEGGFRHGTLGQLFARGWFISPGFLLILCSLWFLWLFPTAVLGMERDGEYDLLLMIFFLVQLAGLVLGQKLLAAPNVPRKRVIVARRSFFRACWIFWGVAAVYKLAMFFLGGIAKYQHVESEAFFHIPYVMTILDSLAFRAAPFVAWVASGGRVTPYLVLAIFIDLLFGVTTLTKEYTVYVFFAALFGMSYWGRPPSLRMVASGAIAILLVFLLGPALIWTRSETIRYSDPTEVVSGIVENVERTLFDQVQRDVTLRAVMERFDLYSAGMLALNERKFEEAAVKSRDALPFFWVPRSQEKEITFRAGNYLGASVGLAMEGDVSGVGFPNAVVMNAMFGLAGGLAIFGGISIFFGVAFESVRRDRNLEMWIGYIILYLGIIVQLYMGHPFPAVPYKFVYETFSWGACILLFRACRMVASIPPLGGDGPEIEHLLQGNPGKGIP